MASLAPAPALRSLKSSTGDSVTKLNARPSALGFRLSSTSPIQDSATGLLASTPSTVVALAASSFSMSPSLIWPSCSGRVRVVVSRSESPRSVGSWARLLISGRAWVSLVAMSLTEAVSANSRPLRSKKAPAPGWPTARKRCGCWRRASASSLAAASASSLAGACTTARIILSRCGNASLMAASFCAHGWSDSSRRLISVLMAKLRAM
ncbi:hypothetical protein D3C86_1266450 [compost metagenome]